MALNQTLLSTKYSNLQPTNHLHTEANSTGANSTEANDDDGDDDTDIDLETVIKDSLFGTLALALAYWLANRRFKINHRIWYASMQLITE